MILHWCDKVVCEKGCFYTGFTKVVREKPCKTNVTPIFFADNPPGMVSPDSQSDSQSDSQRTHHGLTMDSQRTHNRLTMDSQWTHKGLTKDSQWIHTKIIEKALVFLGCPRKRLFLHWFYKVVREKCCFYIGFTRLSAKSVVFTLVLQWLSAKMLVKPV